MSSPPNPGRWVLAGVPLLGAGCADRQPDSRLDAAPTTDALAQERERMVRTQIEARGVVDAHVLAALRAVPRHEFVPEGLRAQAHADRPLAIGAGQTVSQPFIVASMTAAARVRPGERVLEIGTGSGYQAAVLACITPHVWTIEILEELGRAAAARLARLGYDSVRCRVGDGYAGWPEAAPFDVVLVTAAADEPPPALLEQLAPGGRMLIPLRLRAGDEFLVRFTKDARGQLSEEALYPVRFVPFTRAGDHE